MNEYSYSIINQQEYLDEFQKCKEYYNEVFAKIPELSQHALKCMQSNPVPLSGISAELPFAIKTSIVLRAVCDYKKQKKQRETPFFIFPSNVTLSGTRLLVETSVEGFEFNFNVLIIDEIAELLQKGHEISSQVRFYENAFTIFVMEPIHNFMM